jgi:hypothetical protein
MPDRRAWSLQRVNELKHESSDGLDALAWCPLADRCLAVRPVGITLRNPRFLGSLAAASGVFVIVNAWSAAADHATPAADRAVDAEIDGPADRLDPVSALQSDATAHPGDRMTTRPSFA